MASITDKPIARLEQDSLNIQKYANSLSKFIRNSDTPITIGLQGEWGTGKTSLMSLLLENFNKDEEKREIATSWVNTWEYSLFKGASETTPAVLSGMLEKLKESCKSRGIWTVKDDTEQKFKSAARFLGNITNQIVAKQTGIDVKGAVGGEGSQKFTAEVAETKALITDLIADLIKDEDNPAKKVVFFVDDLDRIPPTDAVEVLESLKNIFDIPNCVFILAIDYEIVVKGLKDKFGDKTKENEREFRSFFDKIIQVPFTMPVGAYDITTFLKTKLNDLGVEPVFIEASIGQITKIVRYTVGNNPRSLKRYLNTFSLINQIMDDDDENEKDDNNIILLFAVLGIQVSYPQIFRLLTQNPDYLSWNEKFGNKIGLDLSKIKDNIESVGESDLTDETWEQIIWGFCQEDPYLKVKCFNILELFNFLRELFCKNDLKEEWNDKLKEDSTKYNNLKEKLYERLTSVLEFAAITNVDDDIEVKSITTKGSVVYFDGFDGWIQEMRNGQEENKQLNLKKRPAYEVSSEMEDCLKYWCDYFQSEGHDLTYTPGGGCTVKHKKIKIINLEIKKSKIAFNILRASERDYYRPLIDGLDSSNIRRYAPLEGQFTPLYKEFFKLIGDIKGVESKKSELKSIFKEAVETIDDDNKLKVNKGNHHILEDIFNGTYTIN